MDPSFLNFLTKTQNIQLSSSFLIESGFTFWSLGALVSCFTFQQQPSSVRLGPAPARDGIASRHGAGRLQRGHLPLLPPSALHALLRAGLAAHLHVAKAVVDAYAKLSCLGAAWAVFDEMRRRDVVTWTSLLTGFARAGSHDSAVRVYHDMVAAGVDPAEFAVAAVLSSCTGSTMLELGRSVHATAVRFGFEPFLSIGNSLVSMYAKTGSLGARGRSSMRCESNAPSRGRP